MIDFAYQPGVSVIHKMNPAAKILLLTALSAVLLSLDPVFGTIAAITIIFLMIWISGLEIKTVFHPVKRIIWFLIMIFLMNTLFYESDECIYSFAFICISVPGLIQGYNIILRTISVTILASIFIRTTTSIEIMNGLETIMIPLKKIGVPTRDIALIMSISLQFIPVFYSDLDRIRKAQISRGADFSGGSWKDRIKSAYPLVIPAFISAFRRADDLALAMDARGFRSEKDSGEKPSCPD